MNKKGSFKKGKSGNPGGRPPVVKEFHEALKRIGPKAIDALEQYIRDPTPEEHETQSPLWFAALADKRLDAIKIVVSKTIPNPKDFDPFAIPVKAVKNPEKLTTLDAISAARCVLMQEIGRFKAVSSTGVPLTDAAASRFSECMRQLKELIDQEERVLKSDEFAKLTESDLRAALANANNTEH